MARKGRSTRGQQRLQPEHDENALDKDSTKLIADLRLALSIHAELLRRLLQDNVHLSPALSEVLEDIGNRYLDFSDEVAQAVRRSHGE